jgi:endoglucanase
MKKAAKLTAFALSVALFICGCGNDTNASDTSGTGTAAETTAAVTEPVKELNYGEMRDIDIHELVGEMKTGWNLGNTMDSLGGETAWGNPKTTKEMIDAVAEAGFNVIRIPTSWGEKMITDDGSYKVPDEWMSRVHEIVDYAFENDMYVILNTHHETAWIKPATDQIDSFLPQFTSLWTQIAESFEQYGDHLLFEGLNEPRIEGGKNEWNGGTADGREALNTLNKAFVDTVRATGGNNSKRALLITTFAAAITNSSLKDLVIPDDDRIIVSLHAYTPYNYTYNSKESWEVFTFTDSVAKEIDNVFNLIDQYLTDNKIPVIITEYGSVSKRETEDGERNDAENVKWVKYYLERAKKSGIPCVWWDNGYYYSGNELFGIFNRKTCEWFVPDLVEAIMSVYK